MAGFNSSRSYIIILIYLFLSNYLFAQQNNKIHYKVINLHSNILNEERILNVYLPDDYKSTQIKYPVLYQLDGAERNFLNAVHTVRNLSSCGEIPGMIVVGITNNDRWRDMLPVKLKKHPTAGGALQFSKFIHLELVRYIEKNYRTNHVRILSGRSNSALFTVFVLTENKNEFTGYIASSPSLGHCKDYMFNKMTSFLSYHSEFDKFLFISNGGRDNAVRLMTPIPEFIGILKEKSSEKLIWQYKYYENEGHCPAPTLRDGLSSFFKHFQTSRINYLNQKPPGPSAKRFAPGFISTNEYSEAGCTFTPDGKEFYFTRIGGDLPFPTTFVCRFQNNNWSHPQKASFVGFGPQISPDGKKMFISKFGYTKDNKKTAELWFMNREDSKWIKPRYHGPGLRASVSNSLNLYYINGSNEKDRGVIAVQKFINNQYLEQEIPVGGVNTQFYEAHPCIAKDESYIIFDSNRPGGYGKGDLYLCFRNDDGTWGKAINLGANINTQHYEGYASISPDGKYLFYSSDKNGSFDLYWIDAKIIKEFRNTE